MQPFFGEVLTDLKLYANGVNILEKVEADGNFALLSQSFGGIIRHEIVYAVCGGLTRAEEDEREALLQRDRRAGRD